VAEEVLGVSRLPTRILRMVAPPRKRSMNSTGGPLRPTNPTSAMSAWCVPAATSDCANVPGPPTSTIRSAPRPPVASRTASRGPGSPARPAPAGHGRRTRPLPRLLDLALAEAARRRS